jgi:hypothetical protein
VHISSELRARSDAAAMAEMAPGPSG